MSYEVTDEKVPKPLWCQKKVLTSLGTDYHTSEYKNTARIAQSDQPTVPFLKENEKRASNSIRGNQHCPPMQTYTRSPAI